MHRQGEGRAMSSHRLCISSIAPAAVPRGQPANGLCIIIHGLARARRTGGWNRVRPVVALSANTPDHPLLPLRLTSLPFEYPMARIRNGAVRKIQLSRRHRMKRRLGWGTLALVLLASAAWAQGGG